MRHAAVVLLLVLPAAAQQVKLKPVELNEVHWTTGFWADRFNTVRENTLPVILRALQDPNNGAQYTSFRKTANIQKLNWWSDGDVYKTVEAMALVYQTTREPALDRRMDEMIAAFAAAQEPDGYISTPIKLKGSARWQNLNRHELYNMGHLMTAACVHYRATGKKNFLDIAVKVPATSTPPSSRDPGNSRTSASTRRTSWGPLTSTMPPATASTWNWRKPS